MSEIIDTKRDETGREYSIYSNGLELWKDTGKIKKPAPLTVLTRERAIELRLHQRRALEKAAMNAFARKVGVDPDLATEEEVITGAGNAIEKVYEYVYDLAMNAKTGRDVEGVLSQLTKPFGSDQEKGGTPVIINNSNAISKSPEQIDAEIHFWREVIRLRKEKLIEGTATDVPPEGEQIE